MSRNSERHSDESKDRPGNESAWQVNATLAIGGFMTTDVAYLREHMWVDAAVTFLAEHGLRESPVLDDDGRPVGMFYADDVDTEESLAADQDGSQDDGDVTDVPADQILGKAAIRGYGLGPGFHLQGQRRLRVREVMVPYVPELPADASIATAALVMHDNQLDHLMVVGDDGRAVGSFSREDLVAWLVEQTSGKRFQGAGARCLRDVMRPAISVRRRASLLTARDLFATHDVSELPVVEAGRVVGVIGERDICGIVAAHRDDDGWMQELMVEDVMKTPPLIRGPETAIATVKALLEDDTSACVLVEQDGRLIGIVSARDLEGVPAVTLSGSAANHPHLTL